MFYSFVAGPYSRTAESRLSELINGGLTTVVGLLGTDGVTRRSVKFFYFFPVFRFMSAIFKNDVAN